MAQSWLSIAPWLLSIVPESYRPLEMMGMAKPVDRGVSVSRLFYSYCGVVAIEATGS
jgi:hypothetical protein